jgi:prepilin-type N-terminal cleavage/methylation domain-containing protein
VKTPVATTKEFISVRSSPGERHGAFTLIELLVAMAILVIIVLIVSMIFQRASVAWDTGARKAELDMTGRGVADFMAQELATAVRGTNRFTDFSVSGSAANFWVLSDATATNRAGMEVTYSGVTRNGEPLAEGVQLVAFSCEPASPSAGELPRYADVTVTLTNNYGSNVIYQSRAYFMNRGRDRL